MQNFYNWTSVIKVLHVLMLTWFNFEGRKISQGTGTWKRICTHYLQTWQHSVVKIHKLTTLFIIQLSHTFQSFHPQFMSSPQTTPANKSAFLCSKYCVSTHASTNLFFYPNKTYFGLFSLCWMMNDCRHIWLCNHWANDTNSRPYLDSLHGYREQCDTVLGEVTQCVDFLRQLHMQYINVSTKTNALHDECEHLLAEQVVFLWNWFIVSLSIDWFAGLISCLLTDLSTCSAH